MTTPLPLDASLLRPRCDPGQFDFQTTSELTDVGEIVGQARALEALRFGVGIQHHGYNLYVLGPAGGGKHSAVLQFLTDQATAKPRPDDWCYVNNFENPQTPKALRMPAGTAAELRKDLDRLVQDLRTSIPAALESDDFRNRMEEIQQESHDRHEHAFSELQQEAEQQGMALLHTPRGFAIAPVKDGQVLGNEEFKKLPKQEQDRIEAIMAELRGKLRAIIERIPQWQRERQEKERALVRETTMATVKVLIEELKAKYAEHPAVLAYLDAVCDDVIDHARDFQHQQETPMAMLGMQEPPSFSRLQVNVLVDHTSTSGAPVLYETNPTYQNLIGRVEHLSRLGALVTDFTLIRSGALHRANGGYLILDAHRVLMEPYAWEALKRALSTREIRVESLGQHLSLISTVSLEPQPIALDLKVVLIGERLLYYLLCALDPDFLELFKVAADFEDRIQRDDDGNRAYARLIATLGRNEGLRPFDRTAVARIIEQSARMVGDAHKLSTHMRSVADLLHASDYWAGQRSKSVVDASDVQQAIDAEIGRLDRIRREVQEQIQRGTILIDTAGEQVGQVNGLSVIDLGNFAFGQPSRITATVRLGKGELVDIEREAELGGALHSKGVMILSAFLGARYAANFPLSLSGSLVFEQSYGMVEGDSASVAELCALLSALGDVPVRQSLAVTGSVNQHGRVQAIGAVNEKIEGYFDICRPRGLADGQGVIIPADNVKHLMLREDVVEAAAAGRFHIYPVTTIDEAVSLLTGTDAGERQQDGQFPPESVNGRVSQRLMEFALTQQEFAERRNGSADSD